MLYPFTNVSARCQATDFAETDGTPNPNGLPGDPRLAGSCERETEKRRGAALLVKIHAPLGKQRRQ